LTFFRDSSPQKLKVIGFWCGYWVFYSIADVFLTELKGHEKMGQVALLGLLLKIISTAAGIFLIHLGFNYDIVLVVLPISSFVYLVICVLVSIHYLGPFQFKFRGFTRYKKIFKELLPFFITVVLVEILYTEDILILEIIKDDRSVGIYSSAIKIVSFILGISPFFHVAMLPILSRLFLESKEKLIKISKRTLRYLILVGLPISAGLSVTSDKIINLLYPAIFQEADIVLKIASWAIAIGLMQATFSVVLTAINRQKEKVIYIGITFGIITLLNLIFIFYFDYIGAAIVKVIAELLGLIFFIYLVSKYLAFLSILRLSIKPVLACILMTIFAYGFRYLGLVYLIPLSAAVYVIAFVILGGLSRDEIRYIKNLLKGRHSTAIS
jgi:O-antigen/teichoic acid export membrane protein